MSFSFTAAGSKNEVAAQVGRKDHPAFKHGGTLADIVRAALAEVVALGPADRRLIVETNGHADSHNVSLTIRVMSVYDWPDEPAPAPVAEPDPAV